ncbi:hypothetical protein DJ71_27100 [Halorubrum sp. E3]|nr:hypothetical protein DJ71_27100 [Halorubrum sp. E3]
MLRDSRILGGCLYSHFGDKRERFFGDAMFSIGRHVRDGFKTCLNDFEFTGINPIAFHFAFCHDLFHNGFTSSPVEVRKSLLDDIEMVSLQVTEVARVFICEVLLTEFAVR